MDETFDYMEEKQEERFQEPKKPVKMKLIGLIVTIIVVVILMLAILGSDSVNIDDGSFINIGGVSGVTMRELQLDFNDEDHGYRHYDEGDTVVLVDQITSLEVETGRKGNYYTMLEFSAKPLPDMVFSYDTYSFELDDSEIEDWFTYTPGTSVSSTFDGDIAVEGDITDTYNVGDRVKITLNFISIDVPGVFGDEAYTTEKIVETMPLIGGITADEIEKVG